jgi:hypothetical protein
LRRKSSGLIEIENLTGLRSGNHALEVGIFAALRFALPFSGALISALLLVHLLLSANPLSKTFLHVVLLSRP